MPAATAHWLLVEWAEEVVMFEGYLHRCSDFAPEAAQLVELSPTDHDEASSSLLIDSHPP